MSPPPAHVLVVAKAPVAGQAKTRLGAAVGMAAAARLAAAALLDTLAAAAAYAGTERCHVALAGDLDDVAAPDAAALRLALDAWHVRGQADGGFDERLAAAHAAVPGPVVQIGMDTPQVTPALLAAVAAGLDDHDAVLAPAADGGWWALALRDPQAARALVGVPMSTDETYVATRAALRAAGLDVGTAPALVDVDEVDDARAVAAEAPATRFAVTWRAADQSDRGPVPNHCLSARSGSDGSDVDGGGGA